MSVKISERSYIKYKILAMETSINSQMLAMETSMNNKILAIKTFMNNQILNTKKSISKFETKFLFSLHKCELNNCSAERLQTE